MRKLLSLALLTALAIPVGGCASSTLKGTYREVMPEIVNTHQERTLSRGSQWEFFWGLFDSGTFNVDDDLRRDLGPDQGVVGMTVTDHLSVGGFFLWLFTAGIISHHSIVVDGSVVDLRHPEVIVPVPSERTIIVPTPPAVEPEDRPILPHEQIVPPNNHD